MNTKSAIKNKQVIGFLPIQSIMEQSADCSFEFKNSPYHISTLFYVGSSTKFKAYVKKAYGNDLSNLEIDFNTVDGLTIPCTASNGVKIVIIYMPEFHFSINDFSTLVHEIEHAVVYILKFSGCHPVMFENTVDEDSDDESLAYLEGNMFNTIISKLSKKFLTNLDKCKTTIKKNTSK